MNLRLLFEYIFYAVIIVIGLIVLGVIKKKNRLPSHAEFKRQLVALLDKLKTFRKTEQEEEKSNYDFFKKIADLIYQADKLIYTSSMMANTERDVEIDSVSTMIETAKNDLLPYKFGKKDKDDSSGLCDAEKKLEEAVSVLDKILARDIKLKQKT